MKSFNTFRTNKLRKRRIKNTLALFLVNEFFVRLFLLIVKKTTFIGNTLRRNTLRRNSLRRNSLQRYRHVNPEKVAMSRDMSLCPQHNKCPVIVLKYLCHVPVPVHVIVKKTTFRRNSPIRNTLTRNSLIRNNSVTRKLGYKKQIFFPARVSYNRSLLYLHFLFCVNL